MTIDLTELAKWIGVLSVIAGAIWKIGAPITTLLIKLNKHLEKSEADELGLRTLLKYRLTVISKRAIARKGITVFERAILRDGLKSYHGLGGNGEIGSLVEQALSLPVVSDQAMDKIINCDDAD